MPLCCLATGRLGCCSTQAWHRDSKGPCPLPPAWSYEESTGWHDENKVIITETPNVTISWTRMIGHCCTMISLKRVHSCDGHFHVWTKKQCKKWLGPRIGLALSRVHKLSYAKKKVFLFLKLLLWKISHWALFYSQYVNLLVFSKYFVQLFSSEHYVYLNICASAIDNLSVRLNPNIV